MFGDLGVNMNFYASAVGQTLRLASGGVMFSICPSVCPCLPFARSCASVAKLRIHGTTAWNDKLWGQAVKDQGHTMPNIDLEAWRRHHYRSIGSSSLSSLLIHRTQPIRLDTEYCIQLINCKQVKVLLEALITFWWNFAKLTDIDDYKIMLL